ncbi:MAG: serine hydrolase domain-containing protein, partial [Kineosporiaceae bacterium]
VRHGLLGVAAVDGSWSWTGAHGVLDPEGTPATPAARYPVASVTKLYTATVVMRLVEQGGLALGDRLVDRLPDGVADRLHVLDGIDRTGEIAVEHLLGHTSGLADYYDQAPSGKRSAQARLLAGEDAPVPFDEVLRLVREDLAPHFPPQPVTSAKRRARYADTNYQLLGAIVEHVTGEALHEVFDRTLFGPLGLASTSSYPHEPRSGASLEPDARVWSRDTILKADGALRHQKADGGIISTL